MTRNLYPRRDGLKPYRRERGVALSVLALLVAVHGEDPGYRPRQRLSDDVDAAVLQFYVNAKEMYGEEQAALHLAHLLAKAPPGSEAGYEPQPWAVRVLKKHRSAIAAFFTTRAVKPEPKVSGMRDRESEDMRRKLDKVIKPGWRPDIHELRIEAKTARTKAGKKGAA